MSEWIQKLNFSIFGNTLAEYIVAIGLFWFFLITLQFLIHTVFRKLEKLVREKGGDAGSFVFDEFERTLYPVFYVGVAYLSLKQLTLNETLGHMINILALVVLVIQGTRFTLSFLTRFLSDFWLRREADASTKSAIETIITLLKVGIWGVAVVLILENLGFNVSAVVAGLGIGGVAVALAAQTILGDLFNYFVIFFDKPFQQGDVIDLGDGLIGEIERIGLKSTRLRSLTGEQVVVSNSDLTGNRIRNYKRMEKRRVLFQLGLIYQTPGDKLKKAVALIKEILQKHDGVIYERVHFKAFGDFSLNIEVVFYVKTGDYNKYMDILEQINFKIRDAFEKEGLEFAYPTQTHHVLKSSAGGGDE